MTPVKYVRLSVMMLMQFFLWSSWYVTAYLFLGKEGIGFGGPEIGWTYSVGPIAGILSPFIVGMLADRYFATERVLGVLHILGGLIMFGAIFAMGGGEDAQTMAFTIGKMSVSIPNLSTAAKAASPLIINLLFFGHMLCYYPTLSLTNSLALHNLTDAEKQFPYIRVWGTIGWILAGFFISWQGWDAAINIFYVAAAASILMGVYSFTLPHTPPPLAGKKVTVGELFGLDALVLFKKPSFAIFMVASFLVCIPLAFYYQLAGKFVDHAGIAQVAQTMSYGQISEIVFMLIMPFFFAFLRVKWMLFVGMAAWVLRYGMFGMAGDDGGAFLVVGGVVLHGICYDFFFVTGQIYTDRTAPSSIRGQAQGLLVLCTLGFGMLIGALTAGYIEPLFQAPHEVEINAKLAEMKPTDDAELDPVKQAAYDELKATLWSEQAAQRAEGIKTLEKRLLDGETEKAEQIRLRIAALREERSDLLLKTMNWRWLWWTPAIFAAVIMVAFALTFYDDPKEEAGKPVEEDKPDPALAAAATTTGDVPDHE